MRLFAKFFLCAVFTISVALLISGYLLITLSHENAIIREAERALNQFQFDRFTVQANIIADAENLQEGLPTNLFYRLSSELSGLAAFFDINGQLIYSALPTETDFSFLGEIADNTHVMQFQTVNGATYIMVSGRITQSDITLYFLVANDISSVTAHREYMAQGFIMIYFFTLLFGMAMIVVLSAFMTGPIKRMNRAAAKIAQGNYNERLKISSGDEIGELSNSFNLMADAIEDKIHELSENARQKEDFVANFAHELKTPLTSVIGYADMIYQKSLPPERVKDAAWYILNEGLRLESLSLKLMDLIVLNRQNFILEEMNTEDLFGDISGSLKPMLSDKDVSLQLNIQPAYIKVEYDLFKTLMFNLIDNAVKAGCNRVIISGKKNGNLYSINIIDNGRGMPQSEIAKITEAFYTVDKSRSRRQHGAGIGLALVAKIVEIHDSTLKFNSAEDIGTDVRFDFWTVPNLRKG
ncbi:MAG: HAMP domain-containing histidine kinase [Defluviitaleaceae bacterium]|nr:HAMP domain-containing histidine kinase [Defluviitaleaceae bacterium]